MVDYYNHDYDLAIRIIGCKYWDRERREFHLDLLCRDEKFIAIVHKEAIRRSNMTNIMSTNKEDIAAAADKVAEAGYFGVAEIMRGWASGTGIKAWAVQVQDTDSYGSETGGAVTLSTKIDKETAEQNAYEYNCKLVARFTKEHDWPHVPNPKNKYGWGGSVVHPRGYENFCAFMENSAILLDNIGEANAIIEAVTGRNGTLNEDPMRAIDTNVQRRTIVDAFDSCCEFEEKSFQKAFVVETTIG